MPNGSGQIGKNVDFFALLVALPKATNVLDAFEVQILARILEATGWDVTLQEARCAEDAARAAADEWIGLLEVTLSSASGLELVSRSIATARKASKNPHLRVIVTGDLFTERPELAAQVGADATASDASTVAFLASHLLMQETE